MVRTSILNTKQSLTLQKYEEEFDFWRPARPGMSADIMVPPGTKFLKFAQNMRREGIDFSVIIPDIGAMIENQKSAKSAPYDGKISFDQYYPHDDLNAYIDDLAAANDFINTVSIGQSHEGTVFENHFKKSHFYILHDLFFHFFLPFFLFFYFGLFCHFWSYLAN